MCCIVLLYISVLLVLAFSTDRWVDVSSGPSVLSSRLYLFAYNTHLFQGFKSRLRRTTASTDADTSLFRTVTIAACSSSVSVSSVLGSLFLSSTLSSVAMWTKLANTTGIKYAKERFQPGHVPMWLQAAGFVGSMVKQTQSSSIYFMLTIINLFGKELALLNVLCHTILVWSRQCTANMPYMFVCIGGKYESIVEMQ